MREIKFNSVKRYWYLPGVRGGTVRQGHDRALRCWSGVPSMIVQQDDLIGVTLANYKILAPLGQGGMARVYKARQENLDREVAIKVLPPWFAADNNFK